LASGDTKTRTPEHFTVAANLRQAGDRMDQAIAAFARATRMRLIDVVKAPNIDPGQSAQEEVHVQKAIDSLMEAVDLISSAYTTSTRMKKNTESKELIDCTTQLNVSFKTLLNDLQRPQHRRIIAQLKQARRLIPNRLVKQLTKG